MAARRPIAVQLMARKLADCDFSLRRALAQDLMEKANRAREALETFPGAESNYAREVSHDMGSAARLAEQLVDWHDQVEMMPLEMCVPEPELRFLAGFTQPRLGVVPEYVSCNRLLVGRLERHLNGLDNLERTFTQVTVWHPAVDYMDAFADAINWPLLRDLSRELRVVLDAQEFLLD